MVFKHVRAARDGCFTDSGQDATFCRYVSENSIKLVSPGVNVFFLVPTPWQIFALDRVEGVSCNIVGHFVLLVGHA